MNLLQQPPPDTLGYMVAGYTVIFSVMLLYVLSLVIRQRNLIQDLESLEDLDSHPQHD